MRLRIMSYNILFGGRCDGAPDRTDEILEVIRTVEPDLLVLQEASGFAEQDGGRLALYEQRLGMTGLIGLARSTLHVALLVRPPLELALLRHDAGHFRHCGIVTRLSCDTVSLQVVATHLNPFTESARVAEAGHLAALLGVEPGGQLDPGSPLILVGDLNGLSAADPLEPEAVTQLLPQYRVPYPSESMGPFGNDRVECRALACLGSIGLVDLGHAFPLGDRGTTYPTPGAPAPEGPPIRIDYVMGTPVVVPWVHRYDVIRTPLTDRASDHYPVVCELQV